jgi:small subunit ribosomal protein S15
VEKEQKNALIETYRINPQDTGSPDVQIALLTHRISEMTEHLRRHRHDFSSQRGLLQMIGLRRRLMRYLRREDIQRYRALISQLGIRG